MATDLLRSLSLAINLLGNDPNAFDDRLQWQDYAWSAPAFNQCLDQTAEGSCHAVHARWDWKRNQWVDFWYRIDRTHHTIELRLDLSNNDPHDDDFVCVTALFIGADGKDLFAFHQNWHALAGEERSQTFDYAIDPAVWQRAQRVVVGSKQCRDGPHEDDEVFAAVKARLQQP